MVDVTSLRNEIKGTVLLPGDEGYEESLVRWAKNAERRAGYVVQVTSATDAATTVFYFPFTYTLTSSLNLRLQTKFLSLFEVGVIQLLVHLLLKEAS